MTSSVSPRRNAQLRRTGPTQESKQIPKRPKRPSPKGLRTSPKLPKRAPEKNLGFVKSSVSPRRNAHLRRIDIVREPQNDPREAPRTPPEWPREVRTTAKPCPRDFPRIYANERFASTKRPLMPTRPTVALRIVCFFLHFPESAKTQRF